MSLTTDLVYTTSRGVSLNLGRGEARRHGEDTVRQHEWTRKLGRRGVSGVSSDAQIRKIQIVAASAAEMDRIRRLMDADAARQAAGTFAVGDWRQRGLLLSSSPDSTRGVYAATLEVALLDGYWRRAVSVDFTGAAADGERTGLDLPTDMPFDLGIRANTSEFTAGIDMDADIKLLIFGPCINPSVTVGGNRYALDASVPSGARVEVDGASWPRTIELVGIDGQRTGMFGAGHRASGVGSGEYIFEPLHPTETGVQPVEWDGSFSWQLIYYERDTEPEWGGELWS